MTLLWCHDACSSLLGTRESLPVNQRVPYLWLKKNGREWEKEASALGLKMETQTLSHFDLIQTEGAAYSTFYLWPYVPVHHKNLYLRVVYFNQQTHACACIHMVKNNEKHLKITKKYAQETLVRLRLMQEQEEKCSLVSL